jgi:hypothetical protein
MSIRNLKVIKKPRVGPIPDIPINFPAFTNLHLELLEVKEKLKRGLPLIPKSKPNLKLNTDPVKVTNPAGPVVTTDKKPLEPITIPITIPVVKKKKKENFIPEKKEKATVAKSESESESIAESDTSETSKSSKKNKPPPKIPKKPVKELKNIKAESKEQEETLKGLLSSEDETISDGEEDAVAQEDSPVEEVKAETDETDIYAGLSPEERAEKEKEEYIWRFRILKKQYGKNASIPIPEWNEFSDLGMMKQSYERTIKELYLDDAVETYRTYLLGGWIVMEYVCTQFIGIDLRGFTLQQTKMMYKYDRMLIELGEKSYTSWAMNLPVEVRLIGMILFQAAIFYLGKIISDKLGNSIGELFKGFTGQPPDHNNNNNNTGNTGNNNEDEVVDSPKKKMRGPKINADEIRARNNKK